jgi:hypothetical protein
VYVPVIAVDLRFPSAPITSAVYVPAGVKPVNRCPAAASAADTVAVATGVPVADDPLYRFTI